MRKAILTLLTALGITEPVHGDQLIDIGTDVAGFLIFHPDDLAHRAADPIAWYAYGFAYQKESAAGRLVGFSTAADGGFLIRMTTGPLTENEARFSGPSWSYPLIIRHGRIYLDNGDGLPGEERMDDPADFPERWFTLPNGCYRVDVQAIIRSSLSAPDNLPDYVIAFHPTDDLASIRIAENLPRIPQWPDEVAQPSESQDRGFGRWPEVTLAQHVLPTLQAGENVIPGQVHRLAISETDYGSYSETLREFRILTFPDGQFGLLAQIVGISLQPKIGGSIEFSIVAPVKITHEATGDLVSVELLPKPDMQVEASEVENFKSLVAKEIDSQPDKPSSFERERFTALQEAEAVTTWALMYLSIAPIRKNEIYRYGAGERIRLITETISSRG